MPIYGKALTPPPWILETKLSKQSILKLRTIFNRALKDNHTGVQLTLTPNEDYSKPFLYTFDSTKYSGTFNNYSTDLEALINKANVELAKDKIYGKDYRFDIMGNWSWGNIIIMKRSDIMRADYRKQVEKYEKETKNKLAKLNLM